ncbi:MAG TPA: hypothetical protein VJH96_00320 [Patescibacteria group bacterium]|nr:hypothetical protein [Patescibacteria group bacterium]
MGIVFDLAVFIFSFFLVWFSAGFIVSGIERFSKKLSISAFAISFIVLGLLTSIPELSIGINSVIDRNPSIFAGNLIGASFILFVLVIPVLAILAGRVSLAHELSGGKLVFSLLVVLTPLLLSIDGKLTREEGLLMMALYCGLVYMIEKKKRFLEKIHDDLLDGKPDGLVNIVKIIIGSLVIFGASRLLVEKTELFSELFSVSPFLISLLVLSVGTNIPEIAIAIRSVIKRNSAVAFGDYVGSAAANTFIFGLLVLVNGTFYLQAEKLFSTFVLFTAGISVFYLLARSRKSISRHEAFFILIFYVIFVIFEIVTGI